METKKDRPVLRGMRDGLPIGLGYFAVAFSLGIACSNAGITAIQGFIMSMVNMASAGEYAGIKAIDEHSSYIGLAILILITNARYLLMSTALSQKIDPKLRFSHRLGIGSCITDEIFGISISQQSPLNPKYVYGSYIPTIPLWSAGTALGIIAGNILPITVVSALSAAIYGMFIAVVIPPSRKDKVIFIVVAASFIISGLTQLIPWFANLSESWRIIILTLVISVCAALIFPRKDEEEGPGNNGEDGHDENEGEGSDDSGEDGHDENEGEGSDDSGEDGYDENEGEGSDDSGEDGHDENEGEGSDDSGEDGHVENEGEGSDDNIETGRKEEKTE